MKFKNQIMPKSKKKLYKINVVSFIGKPSEGACMWDWFKDGCDPATNEMLSADKLRWADKNAASTSAARLYRGNDVAGVGVRWDIVRDL